jgi:hypothetical protein
MARKPSEKRLKLIADQAAALTEYAVNALIAAGHLRIKNQPVEGLSLSQIDRADLAVMPSLAMKVKKKLTNPNAAFTVTEAVGMIKAAADFLVNAKPTQRVGALLASKKLIECLQKTLVMPKEAKIGRKPAPSGSVYQLKITLKESQPPIWRRIQIKDCTLDELHGHIQTAMGWTNSHLHHFHVGEQLFGDPVLMQENFDELGYEDSTTANLSDIIPGDGMKFRFLYEYDFGDSWYHEVLVESCTEPEPGKTYPACLAEKRACPPEDCGGIWGYPDFVEAIENPDHDRHEELLEWIGGEFDPEAFDPTAATKAMKKGLRDWR